MRFVGAGGGGRYEAYARARISGRRWPRPVRPHAIPPVAVKRGDKVSQPRAARECARRSRRRQTAGSSGWHWTDRQARGEAPGSGTRRMRSSRETLARREWAACQPAACVSPVKRDETDAGIGNRQRL